MLHAFDISELFGYFGFGTQTDARRSFQLDVNWASGRNVTND